MESRHELIMPNSDIPFKMFLFEGNKENYFREKHWHHSLEIFALFEGEVCIDINGRDNALNGGELMLINSNEVHSIQTRTDNKAIVLQLPMANFEKYYTEEGFIHFSHSKKVSDQDVMGLIAEMYHIYMGQETGYELAVLSLFYRLVYILIQKYRKENVDPQLVRDYQKMNRLNKITSYIKKNYRNDISLESLAEQFGYSPTYLSRLFRKHAQITFKQYLDSVRLSHAAIQLRETSMRIGEIAIENGFANSKAFAKVYMDHFGEMPSDYRKREKDKK